MLTYLQETDGEDPEFDTTLPGPWMQKWEIIHMNKHTQRHKRDEALQA